jgi:hypothetical protein
MLARQKLYCHPNNKEWLLAGLYELEEPPLPVINPLPRLSVWGTDVIFSEAVPERNIRKIWHPPEDRFVEYEESDYGWLERLGMGYYTYKDIGPALYTIEEPKWIIQLPIMKFPRFNIIYEV